MELPATIRRVEDNTNDAINSRIERETLVNLSLACRGGGDAIDRRLKELDREWDIERVLEANASSMVLLTLTLGLTASRKFFGLTMLVGGFLLQHALQGWCPPVPVLRRLGVRTPREIEIERTALRILREDFTATENPQNALRQAKR
ncbi:MAG TPA: hypothetical protein VLE43_17225 [Candidatus Saccharimonadia bacterium]|nr:hypothetical protein [Candidatus Saccharimonadia bacterium]